METINKSSKEDIIKQQKTKPTYEEFYQFYVAEGHSLKECEQHFGFGHRIIEQLAHQWDLIEVAKSMRHWEPPLTLEEIQRVYLDTNVGGKEAAQQLGVSFTMFRRCLAYYNAHKDATLITESIQNVWNQKYSEGHPLRDEQIRSKMQQTCLEKYGVTNPAQNPEIIAKIKAKTTQQVTVPYEELYNYYIIHNHSKQECSDYFGVTSSVVDGWLRKYHIYKSHDLIRAKIEKTNLDKYGYKNPMQNSAVTHKVKETSMMKYGTTNPAQAHIQHYEFWDTDEHFKLYLMNLPEKPRILELARFFQVHFTRVIKRVHDLGLESYTKYKDQRSGYEDTIINILKTKFNINNIDLNRRDLLPSGKEIDIYLPDYKVGIEFDGDYWHCEQHTKFQDHGGRSRYHQNKSLEAEEQGIFLFHVFEHEWDQDWIDKNPKFKNSHENILNRLRTILTKASKRIPARLCEVREVSKEDKNLFLEQNHIQGSDRAGSYTLGLYYQNQLVSCMCFGHSKYEKYNYELTRFATVHDTVVQGGASKLFKYFVEHKLHPGENIVSYNDITKTKGDIYKILGFECVSINDPNYWWVNFDTLEVRSRYQEQAAGEVERMHNQGFYRICDCGTKTWVYTK